MANESERRYDEAIRKIGDLHGNMAVLSKLDAILKDYNANADEAEALIQTDGALSGSIVQISNSVLYGLGDKCVTVGGALQKVGFDQALKLVGIALSKQVFMRDLSAYGVSADAYWRYSYFTGVFMESQARQLGMNASDAYLLGLLHSIGRVVINELLHIDEVEVFWDRYLPLSQWETSMVGFTNETAGSLLLRNWGFEPPIHGRLAQQSRRDAVAGDPMLLLLHFAKQLALHLDDAAQLAALRAADGHAYVRRLKRDAAALQRDIEQARETVAAVHETLKES